MKELYKLALRQWFNRKYSREPADRGCTRNGYWGSNINCQAQSFPKKWAVYLVKYCLLVGLLEAWTSGHFPFSSCGPASLAEPLTGLSCDCCWPLCLILAGYMYIHTGWSFSFFDDWPLSPHLRLSWGVSHLMIVPGLLRVRNSHLTQGSWTRLRWVKYMLHLTKSKETRKEIWA